MKGQMFILTMVFLVGLIFAVQNSLSDYSFIDLSRTFEKNDLYLLEQVESSFQSTVSTSKDCSELTTNLIELSRRLDNRVFGNTNVDIEYSLDCSNWNSPVQLTIQLKSIEIESKQKSTLSR